MARELAFDPEEVLDKAMQTFWDKGLENTSISDLVKSTGVQRSGLYSVFKSKEELFKQCFERFLNTVVRENCSVLSGPDVDIEDVKAHFRSFQEMIKDPASLKGCFMCSTATSQSPEADIVGELIADMHEEMTGHYKTAIQNSRNKNLISSTSSDQQLAEYLLASKMAIPNLCRSTNGIQLAESYIAELLINLDRL